MSQTFFSKLDQHEKGTRLAQLGSLGGKVTVWVKGQKDKLILDVSKFDRDRMEIVLDRKEDFYRHGTEILCSFYLKGMTFFSQVIFQKSIGDFNVLHFKDDLFKSERRGSYRLLTYPIYEVWAEFDLGKVYEGGKVVDMKSRMSQTGLFKNFLQLVEKNSKDTGSADKFKVRVLDISTTGLALTIGALEQVYFEKDISFNNVKVSFTEDSILIPEIKVVYVVDYLTGDKNLKKYKVGMQFNNLSSAADDFLGRKINKLLREIDSNKDFEIFLK